MGFCSITDLSIVEYPLPPFIHFEHIGAPDKITMATWRPPPDSPGYILERLNIALIVVSSVTMIARMGTRIFILRSLGWDDLIACVAFVRLRIPTWHIFYAN